MVPPWIMKGLNVVKSFKVQNSVSNKTTKTLMNCNEAVTREILQLVVYNTSCMC